MTQHYVFISSVRAADAAQATFECLSKRKLKKKINNKTSGCCSVFSVVTNVRKQRSRCESYRGDACVSLCAADFVLKQYMGQRKSLESAEVKEWKLACGFCGCALQVYSTTKAMTSATLIIWMSQCQAAEIVVAFRDWKFHLDACFDLQLNCAFIFDGIKTDHCWKTLAEWIPFSIYFLRSQLKNTKNKEFPTWWWSQNKGQTVTIWPMTKQTNQKIKSVSCPSRSFGLDRVGGIW